MTLIELLVSVAVIAVLLLIGIPSFQETIQNNRIVTSSNELIGAFNFARAEAVRRGDSVHLGRRDGSSWTGGLVVWIDADGDDNWDSGEELRLWEAMSDFNSVSSGNSRTVFIFEGTGEVDKDDVFTVCDSRTGETGRDIMLLVSGAISVAKKTCS